MNYPESQLILDEIKKAKRILLNCHRGPDSDSVGSALATKNILKSFGKEVEIICPSKLPPDLLFLKESVDIKQEVDFKDFQFQEYDLIVFLDSSTYGMVSGSKDLLVPNVKKIVIDHHHTNSRYGDINLVDSSVTSTAELLYYIFKDWNSEINSDTATKLLTGILGDTGCFQYVGVGQDTLKVGQELMELGANKDEIVFNIYKSVDFNTVKFWGEVISNLKREENFVWSAIDNPKFKEYGEDPSAKEDASNLFAPIVKGTDFGLIMVESEKDKLSISFRSRTEFDVSQIAQEIGGGGHKVAAGAKIEGLPFNQAVEKVLEVCRKYAKKA